MIKRLLNIVIVAGLVALGWMLWNKKDDTSGGGKKGKTQVEQKMLSFTIDGRSSKGGRQWHLEGTSAEILGEEIHLNTLKAVVYGDDVTVNLTSDRGIYHKDKGEVELLGNVVVKGDDGTTLRTQSARWSQNTKQISTNDEVRIERQGMSARGKGGSANSDDKRAMLKKDIVVAMEPHTTVTCDGPLDVQYSDNKAIFYKNVVVVDKDGKMYADRLTVNFNPDTKKLSQVVAEGHVKVKKGKSYTLSNKAIYTDGTKSAVLIGNPQVVIDPDEIGDLENLNKAGIGMKTQKQEAAPVKK